MKKIILATLCLSLLFQLSGTQAFALAKLGSPIAKEIKGVKLSETAQANDGGVALNRISQGLRQKKVVFAWFNVYVAQFFTAAKPDFTSAAKLKASLAAGYPLVVSMTFLRDVDIGKITEGFKDVFQENGMDVAKSPNKEFLDAIQKTGDVKDRQSVFFVFDQTAGKESFSVQTNGAEIYSLKDQAPGSITPFLNMWLGKTPDKGLANLQDDILKHTLE
jgi:hypothetical protein